jgi:hypothetical protein
MVAVPSARYPDPDLAAELGGDRHLRELGL